MSIPWALAVPVVIFLAVIAPLWLLLHYTTVWRRMRMKTEDEPGAEAAGAELARLRELAQRLENRISTLERILDDEAPEWRTHEQASREAR